jgi:hypothetical protein
MADPAITYININPPKGWERNSRAKDPIFTHVFVNSYSKKTNRYENALCKHCLAAKNGIVDAESSFGGRIDTVRNHLHEKCSHINAAVRKGLLEKYASVDNKRFLKRRNTPEEVTLSYSKSASSSQPLIKTVIGSKMSKAQM